ncbi:hypothetical protein [Nocardioides convexus]|uniref:hypothetical protein n=1 Tax=Nocardioides convexus TaxID=2712224 RepID=UPI0024187DFB|nr:hypothetical protein [Nocardioides convexus]
MTELFLPMLIMTDPPRHSQAPPHRQPRLHPPPHRRTRAPHPHPRRRPPRPDP